MLKFVAVLLTVAIISVELKTVDKSSRATVESSNMPTTWQVEAAEDLKRAYELEATPRQRMEMYAELFQERHSDYKWQTVLNYEEIYYESRLYVRINVDGDVVLMFGV